MSKVIRRLSSPALIITIIFLALSIYVSKTVEHKWVIEEQVLDVKLDQNKKSYYIHKGKSIYLSSFKPVSYQESQVIQFQRSYSQNKIPAITEEVVFRINAKSANKKIMNIAKQLIYSKVKLRKHFSFWSLLPALATIILAWMTKEPLTALLIGVISGSFLLGKFDFINQSIIPSLSSESTASILVLYLILLGALMGIWSRTGAAHSFAVWATKHFVRGPKSAKFIAWLLGVIFFQGGTISTVLVGTTVKPIADEEKISHEELSYIVDSTAAPIAILLPFNAWPGYVQSFMFVSGVSFLATEADRLKFFFASLPLNFYAIFAVIGTFLLSIDKAPFLGKRMRKAIKRSRETGELNSITASPLSSKEIEHEHLAKGFNTSVWEFFIPLLALILIALLTFFIGGTPKVKIAFGVAVLLAASMALFRGMSLHDLMIGIGDGLKGVVMGSVILLLAIAIGQVSQQTGSGIYIVELLGDSIPYIILPVTLQLLTMIIAFSTGTSWGTYAVVFPLAMPLAWAVAQSQGLGNTELFMMINFAAIMNGSIYGDQCSPISDTTILSSLSTGCDLMDHVKTQIIPASVFALLAAIGWTVMTLFC